MNWAILNKTKIKEKILEEVSQYSHPSGEMFVVITKNYREDGGYVLMGWNTFVNILDKILKIKYGKPPHSGKDWSKEDKKTLINYILSKIAEEVKNGKMPDVL